eukprot:2598678-Pyramimonas_sp.AAC.1
MKSVVRRTPRPSLSISERGLSHVLKYIRDNGMPDTISRKAHYRAKEETVGKETTPYGKALQCIQMHLKSGGSFDDGVCAPGPMLHAPCQDSSNFRALMRSKLQKYP